MRRRGGSQKDVKHAACGEGGEGGGRGGGESCRWSDVGRSVAKRRGGERLGIGRSEEQKEGEKKKRDKGKGEKEKGKGGKKEKRKKNEGKKGENKEKKD